MSKLSPCQVKLGCGIIFLMLDPRNIIRTNKRTLSLMVNAKGELIVKAPYNYPENKIFAFIKEKEDWISYLIETVGLTAWKTHKPAELSGGQRQRVAIARALVTKAPVILADEPTANLDSKNGEQILELMQKLNRELSTTFIFSTHDSRIVEMCNHVIYIFDGQKVRETNSVK